MSEFVFRLWVHWAEDGVLPELTVHADTQIEGAALALDHFIAMNCALDRDAYLQCEPCGGECLRVRDVVDWLRTPQGRTFRMRRGIHDPVLAPREEKARTHKSLGD
jgi:hypothetical protein